MNAPVQARSYRKAFVSVLVVNVVLLVGLGLVWWRFHRSPSDKIEGQPPSAGNVGAAEPNGYGPSATRDAACPYSAQSPAYAEYWRQVWNGCIQERER